MKIAIVTEKLYSGGTQKLAINEVREFRKMHHKTDLLVLKKANYVGFSDLLEKYKIEPIYLSEQIPKYLNLNFKIPFFAFFSVFHITYPLLLKFFLKNEKYDVVISHGTYTCFSAHTIAKKSNAKLISFVHDPISYILKTKYKNGILGRFNFLINAAAQLLDKWIIKNSTLVLTSLFEFVESLKKLSGSDNIYLLPDAVIQKNKKEITLKKKNYALAVTKWDTGKNIELLLKLWKKDKQLLPLFIVGKFEPQSLKEKVQKIINKYELEKKVTLIGEVSEERLNKYYKEAKYFIHPCKEAFGMSILEAASFACPCVFLPQSGVSYFFDITKLKFLPVSLKVYDFHKSLSYLKNLNKADYQKLALCFYNWSKKASYKSHCEKILSLCAKEK